MLKQVENFVRAFWKEHGPLDKVLDVGSNDVYGENKMKTYIPGYKEYIGLDMRSGENVDIVMNAHDMHKKWRKPRFDLVLCADTLEHDRRFWLTVENMRGVLKPGGWLLITVPSLMHKRHNHPSDYYRFFDSVFYEVFFKDFDGCSC